MARLAIMLQPGTLACLAGHPPLPQMVRRACRPATSAMTVRTLSW
jgi:hypothetical protein